MAGERSDPCRHGRVIVTGYGRNKFEGADGEVSELTCHALGGRFVFPDLRTVIDIGGQDAKIISLTPDGRMSNFIMNDKCAAGTGRFLEVMANILRLDIDDLGAIAAESDTPAAISSTCTVFAESEVISQLANGVKRPDLVAGHLPERCHRRGVSCPPGRYRGACVYVRRAWPATRRYAAIWRRQLDVEISYDPLAQYFGAIGAALYAWKQASK